MVDFTQVYELTGRHSAVPCQAQPVCQLDGIASAEEQQKLLKPYMQESLQLTVMHLVYILCTDIMRKNMSVTSISVLES